MDWILKMAKSGFKPMINKKCWILNTNKGFLIKLLSVLLSLWSLKHLNILIIIIIINNRMNNIIKLILLIS